MTKAEMKESIGVVPTSKDVFGRRAPSFDSLVRNIAAAQRAKAEAEDEIKTLKEELEVYFADSDSKTIMSDGNKATLVLSSNSHITKKRLIDADVTALLRRLNVSESEASEIMDACTKTTSYTYVKVTPPKE